MTVGQILWSSRTLLAGFSCPGAICVTGMSPGRASLNPWVWQQLGRARASAGQG